MTKARELHAFTATGEGDWVDIEPGWFNVHIEDDGGFDGTIQLQKRYLEHGDQAKVYVIEAVTDAAMPFTRRGFEAERKAQYRLACTARNAGGASGRISQ